MLPNRQFYVAQALLPTPAFDAMLLPRTGVETSLGTAGMNACATYFAQETGIRQKLWGRLATCGGLATRRPFLVNRPADAGCQPARRIPSCPTINAGCSASRRQSGIKHECLRHIGEGEEWELTHER